MDACLNREESTMKLQRQTMPRISEFELNISKSWRLFMSIQELFLNQDCGDNAPKSSELLLLEDGNTNSCCGSLGGCRGGGS